jgi:hypothetical protein
MAPKTRPADSLDLLMPRLMIPLTPPQCRVRSFLFIIRSHSSLNKWRSLTLVWTRKRPTLHMPLELLLPTPLSRNAVTMRTANPRVTSSPWTCAHHLHHTHLPDIPFQLTDLSSQRYRRITSPPPVATRTRTARRLQCPTTLPFLVAHLLPFLAGIPLLPNVVLTPAVAAVAPPLTRWSSAALPMKQPAWIRTPSTGQ